MNVFLLFGKIKVLLKGWFVTLTDICTQFGLDASVFTRDKELEKKVMDVFENVNVKVYIIESKMVYGYSMPGQLIMSNPIILKIRSLPDYLLPGILTGIDLVLGLFGTIEEIVRGSIVFKRNNHLKYNPLTGKFRLGFEHCTVYLTRGCIDLIQNEDQIVALLLEDVGYNTMILFDGVLDLIQNGFATLMYTITGIRIFKFFTNPIQDTLSVLKTYFLFILVYVVVIRTILIYYRRRQYIGGTEFVIKTGYGEPFLEAHKKINKYLFELNSKAQNNLNFVDKLLLMFKRLTYMFYNLISKTGLVDHIERSEREDMIRSKINNYKAEIDKGRIDRTDRIDDNVVMIKTSPILKTIDKVHNNYIQPIVDKVKGS